MENHKTIGFLKKTGLDPMENHKTIGFLRNTGLDHMEYHKATHSAFIVEPPSSKSTVFANKICLTQRRVCRRADDGRL